jgi:hypothetical protein
MHSKRSAHKPESPLKTVFGPSLAGCRELKFYNAPHENSCVTVNFGRVRADSERRKVGAVFY